jgi:hypothetical protein
MACSACGTQHAVEFALDDRGSEFIPVYRFTVNSVSEAGRQEVIQQIRRHHGLSLSEARELTYRCPFVLFPEATDTQATKLRDKLTAAGVVTNVEITEMRRNPRFGPIQKNRLLYHAAPRFSAKRPEWLISPADIPPDMTSEVLQCQACGKFGLVEELEATRCPACRQVSMTIESQWIT